MQRMRDRASSPKIEPDQVLQRMRDRASSPKIEPDQVLAGGLTPIGNDGFRKPDARSCGPRILRQAQHEGALQKKRPGRSHGRAFPNFIGCKIKERAVLCCGSCPAGKLRYARFPDAAPVSPPLPRAVIYTAKFCVPLRRAARWSDDLAPFFQVPDLRGFRNQSQREWFIGLERF
jgi:hypothetical protein